MSKSYRRSLSTVAGPTSLEQARAQSFAAVLGRKLMAKGWSQSDLAREIWGERTDEATGRKSAAGRYNISNYVKGITLPSPALLKKMADALEMTPEELAPDVAADVAERETPSLLVSQPAGRPDLMLVQMNLLLPTELAVRIMGIVSEAQKWSGGPNAG